MTLTNYIADGLYAMTNGLSLTQRMADLKAPQPTETPEQVINGLKKKFQEAGGETDL